MRNALVRLPRPAILPICFLLLLLFLWQVSGFYHDDAYITLRYARNILNGYGLVWNPGEPVEGYSSFLWLMLVTAAGFCRIDLVLATRVLGITCALLTVLLCARFRRNEFPLAALLLASNSCFALWSVGGLETVGFALLVTLSCCAYLNSIVRREFFFAGLIFGVAALMRPEAPLFFAVTFAFCLFKGGKPCRTNTRNALALACGFLLLPVPYHIARFAWYGHVFPCTFYVKGNLSPLSLLFGGRYALHFLAMYGLPLVVFFLPSGGKRFSGRAGYLLTLLLCYSCYVVMIGGDHMQGFRFFVPVLPILYLAVQAAWCNSGFAGRKHLHLTLALLLVAGTGAVSFRSITHTPEATRNAMAHSDMYTSCFPVPDAAAYLGRHVGNYMRRTWPPGSTVAGNIAGSIPYFSGMSFIDMLGLNDYTIAQNDPRPETTLNRFNTATIRKLCAPGGKQALLRDLTGDGTIWRLMPGHGRGDGAYVLSRRPDYIILGPAEGSATPWFYGDSQLLGSKEFHERYQRRDVHIPVFDSFHEYYKTTRDKALHFTYFKRKGSHD